MKTLTSTLLRLILLVPVTFLTITSFAQHNDDRIRMFRATGEIRLDGQLLESSWQSATVSRNFWNLLDTGRARLQTEVRVTYDDKHLYVGAKCFVPAKPVVQTLKRDTEPWGNDGFFVVLDPVNEKRSGYIFGINADAAQTEGIIEVNDMSTDWNTRWFAETHKEKDFYTVEIAIPLSSIRYREGNRLWGINFIRSDMFSNQYSNWAHVPLQWNGFNLNFTGQLEWAEAPARISTARNVIQPYVAGAASRFSQLEDPSRFEPKAGMDAKVSINSSLNLDLTINPDFSQIEVDQQIINLDRFNIQLPERRTFFLENNDLFTSFGQGNNKPFLSRRIGLTADGRPKTLAGGARLTGNINRNLRIGVMDVQSTRFENEAAQNYFVGVFQQKLLTNSTLKGIITNRSSVGPSRPGDRGSDFNRMSGLEFNFLSPGSKHQAAAKAHYSFNDHNRSRSQFLVLSYGYVKNKISSRLIISNIGDNFNPEMGFSPYNTYYDLDSQTLRRKGYTQFWNSTTQLFRPKSQTIQNISLNAETYLNLFSDNTFWEGRNHLRGNLDFRNTARIELGANHFVTRLPFASEFVGQRVEAGRYRFAVYRAGYGTDRRKNLSLFAFAEAGDYYGGKRLTYGGNIDVRKQPHMNFSLGTNLNNITLNDQKINLLLLNTKAEFNFTKTVFWTTFLQYNTQSKNFNVNSRFQWRFKPLSDLFLVYTDNYETGSFSPQSKALSLKLNYWFSL